MRLAVFSDVHGNADALDAVLASLEREKDVRHACLGDLVGYGAEPNRSVELVRERCGDEVVAGNHDWAVLGRLPTHDFNAWAQTAADWTREALTDESRAYLESLPLRRSLPPDAHLVHSSPRQPERFSYVLSLRDTNGLFDLFDERVCFIGHSHRPIAFRFLGGRVDVIPTPTFELEDGARYLVNVGSVGQPRDGDPRAAFVVWDVAAGAIELRRVPYDVEGAGRKIREAGLPDLLAERLLVGQ